MSLNLLIWLCTNPKIRPVCITDNILALNWQILTPYHGPLGYLFLNLMGARFRLSAVSNPRNFKNSTWYDGQHFGKQWAFLQTSCPSNDRQLRSMGQAIKWWQSQYSENFQRGGTMSKKFLFQLL